MSLRDRSLKYALLCRSENAIVINSLEEQKGQPPTTSFWKDKLIVGRRGSVTYIQMAEGSLPCFY